MPGALARLRDRFAARNGAGDPIDRNWKMLKAWRKRGRDWPTRSYYSALLDIADRNVLVVGAGTVGEGKILGLLDASAKVKVVSLTVTDTVERWAQQGKIELALRGYQPSDLDGCFLVIAATENTDTNVRVSGDAEARQMLCNVVDVTHLCNFILPSIVRRGDLTIGVSSGGASPAMARRIRIAIGQCYGDEYEVAMKILGSLRKELKARYPTPADRKIVFERMVYSNFMEMVRAGDTDGIEAWVRKCTEEGPDYTSPERHRRMIEMADPECKLRFKPIQIEDAPGAAIR